MSKKIVIIGAGLSGLSCAYHLKKDYEIYEKENEPGGLCRSRKVNGFTFDFAGHLLHFKTQYVYNLVKNLLHKNLNYHIRNSWIFYKDNFVPYPFQANIYSLPKGVIKECLMGLFCSRKTNKINYNDKNFYEWMLQKFGKGVVNHFMLPYNLKFWKMHPRNLTCEWLDGKIPQPTLKESIIGAFEHSFKRWGYNFHFLYPKIGGISALPLAFEKNIKRISYDYKLKRINLKNKVIVFGNNFTTRFDYLILTIPLSEVDKIIYPIPEKVKIAIKKLRYLSILNLNLGITKHSLCNRHWIYFPEDKIKFYRLGFFNNFSSNLVPSGYSSLYIEVSYLKDNPIKNDKSLIERIYHDLVNLKIISNKNQIVSNCINDIRYGYVIYDHNYRDARSTVLEFLKKNNIFPIGRFGSWKYMSMEETILDGKEIAKRLNCN